MPLTAEDLSCLTVPVICNIAKGSLPIPKHQRGRKEILINYVLEHADAHLKGLLEEAVTLGAKGHLPRGYIEDTLRFFKQFTQKVSRGYMLSSFTMYPPL